MRYELKYLPVSIGTNDCVSIIRSHPASFTRIFPDRLINNIYLDTPDLKCHRETMDGISSRKKFRLRWYNKNWDGEISAKLEVKIKENMIGTKVTTVAEPFADLWDSLSDSLQTLKRQGYVPDAMWPTGTNRYLRSYFGTADAKFRITIDRDLQFGSFLSGPIEPTRPANAIIVELKYGYEDREEGDWIRQYLPFRRTRYSKYAEGILTSLS